MTSMTPSLEHFCLVQSRCYHPVSQLGWVQYLKNYLTRSQGFYLEWAWRWRTWREHKRRQGTGLKTFMNTSPSLDDQHLPRCVLVLLPSLDSSSSDWDRNRRVLLCCHRVGHVQRRFCQSSGVRARGCLWTAWDLFLRDVAVNIAFTAGRHHPNRSPPASVGICGFLPPSYSASPVVQVVDQALSMNHTSLLIKGSSFRIRCAASGWNNTLSPNADVTSYDSGILKTTAMSRHTPVWNRYDSPVYSSSH